MHYALCAYISLAILNAYGIHSFVEFVLFETAQLKLGVLHSRNALKEILNRKDSGEAFSERRTAHPIPSHPTVSPVPRREGVVIGKVERCVSVFCVLEMQFYTLKCVCVAV